MAGHTTHDTTYETAPGHEQYKNKQHATQQMTGDWGDWGQEAAGGAGLDKMVMIVIADHGKNF